MSKIAIVTDSTASIPPELLSKYNITVAPLVLIWGDDIYEDGIDIQPSEFYDKLVTTDVLPTTSQATIATFTRIFKELTDQGYDILTIVLSSKLSGTLDSAIQAKQAFPNATIELVDSLSTSVPLALLVLMVARSVKNGASMADCVTLAEKASKKIKVYFAVDTLTYLHKGGRIGGASRFLGTALNLKPILELRDGKIEGIEKIRTSKKAHARLIELMEKGIENKDNLNFIGIIAANAPDASNYLLNECKSRFQPEEIMIGTLSPVIGAHTGPGTVGVGFL
ncbi:MAG: DegV family protein [Anaerolineaceae bacterium]|nr:DegV family protein [Anaerolineaceae bacterium]